MVGPESERPRFPYENLIFPSGFVFNFKLPVSKRIVGQYLNL